MCPGPAAAARRERSAGGPVRTGRKIGDAPGCGRGPGDDGERQPFDGLASRAFPQEPFLQPHEGPVVRRRRVHDQVVGLLGSDREMCQRDELPGRELLGDLHAAAGLEAGADDDLGGGGTHLRDRLQRGGGALDLAAGPSPRGPRRGDVAVRAAPVPLDHIAVVGQAGAEEMNQERVRGVAGHRHGCRHGAVSFVPVREIGGPTPSPGHPTAAPLTARPPLSMEKGAWTETAAARRRSGQAPPRRSLVHVCKACGQLRG